MNIHDLNNLKSAIKDIDDEINKSNIEIHLRVQQRNRKKCLTIIEGLALINDNEEFLKKLAKSFRETLHCGAIIKKPENIIQMQGDHREAIKEYLIKNKIVNKEQIKIHGG